jgi:hypothetical protein
MESACTDGSDFSTVIEPVVGWLAFTSGSDIVYTQTRAGGSVRSERMYDSPGSDGNCMAKVRFKGSDITP